MGQLKLVETPVSGLLVGCGFEVRNFPKDRCNKPAITAVIDPDTNHRYYRCGGHEGMLDEQRRGTVIGAVVTRRE